MTSPGTSKMVKLPLCQICGSLIATDAATVFCAKCDTAHHRDCWTYNGRCSTFGCGSTRSKDTPGDPFEGQVGDPFLGQMITKSQLRMLSKLIILVTLLAVVFPVVKNLFKEGPIRESAVSQSFIPRYGRPASDRRFRGSLDGPGGAYQKVSGTFRVDVIDHFGVKRPALVCFKKYNPSTRRFWGTMNWPTVENGLNVIEGTFVGRHLWFQEVKWIRPCSNNLDCRYVFSLASFSNKKLVTLSGTWRFRNDKGLVKLYLRSGEDQTVSLSSILRKFAVVAGVTLPINAERF